MSIFKPSTTILIDPIDVNRTTDPSDPFLRLTGSNELVFIELQGSITRLDESEQKLGRIEQTEDGRIYLYVGYQKLEGKVVELKHPFAVLRRNTEALREETQSESVEDTPREAKLELVDVCKKKIYFGTRPEPLNEMEA